MKMDKTMVWQVLIAGGLVAVAVVWRVFNHESMLTPNLELVTAVTLVASVFLHRYFALLVPLAAMLASDLLIGNTDVALFSWSAFALIGLAGLVLRRWKLATGQLVARTTGLGLGAAVFFFVWTNFGVWLMADGSFYPHTWQGLMACYAMAVPFFRATLVSGLVLAPAAMLVAAYVHRLAVARARKLAI
jgi:hypothetical protein